MLPALIALAAATHAQCAGPTAAYTYLERGVLTTVAPKVAVSPSRAWRIEVHLTGVTGIDPPLVVLWRCASERATTLFSLRAAAELFWSPDERTLFVLDEPSTVWREVRLFSAAQGWRAVHPHGVKLDEAIQRAFHAQIGQHAVLWYYPSVAAWTRRDVVLAVDTAATIAPETGPARGYCIGVAVDRETGAVRVLPSGTLAKQYHARCEKLL